MGALKPAEAGAPATPSKEAKRDLNHKTVAERTVTRHRNPHAYPSEEAEIIKKQIGKRNHRGNGNNFNFRKRIPPCRF